MSTPTQQQIEEIAIRYEGATNRDRKFFIEAMTEATQPLLETVTKLERDIENESNKTAGYEDITRELRSQLTTLQGDLIAEQLKVKLQANIITTLEAACAEQRLALEEQTSRTEYGNRLGADFYANNKHFGFCSKGAGNPRECSVCGTYYKMKDALLSTSGQRILEENRRMREALEKIQTRLGVDWHPSEDIAQKALSTNQLNQGK